MSEEHPIPSSEKAVALCYAYEALVKTLHDDGIMDIDHLFKNLAKQHEQLALNESTEAVCFFDQLAEKLTLIR